MKVIWFNTLLLLINSKIFFVKISDSSQDLVDTLIFDFYGIEDKIKCQN